ncbi:hypothetical protein J6590_009680 [Homalodisca vitripennis]|nr:hypothetical protein J6590_009680 [Homalodisca vitripennis]
MTVANTIGEVEVVLYAERVEFVCLSEYWMTTDQVAYRWISGYHRPSSSFCRQDLIRDGTLILTKEKVHWLVKARDDLVQHSQGPRFEVTAVSVLELRTTIICLYRSPDLTGEVMESRRRLQDAYNLQRRGPPGLMAYYGLLRDCHCNLIAEKGNIIRGSYKEQKESYECTLSDGYKKFTIIRQEENEN